MRQFILGFACDRRGVSAVEFALVVPVLLVSLLGVIDLGYVVYQRTDMESALRSGAQYFMNGGEDLTQGKAIVIEAWSTQPGGISVEATTFCLCGEVEHVCNVLCADETYPASYKNLEATATIPGLISGYHTVNQSIRVR